MTEPPRESSGAHAKDIKICFHFGRESRMKTIFREGWCKSALTWVRKWWCNTDASQDFEHPNPLLGKTWELSPEVEEHYIYIIYIYICLQERKQTSCRSDGAWHLSCRNEVQWGKGCLWHFARALGIFSLPKFAGEIRQELKKLLSYFRMPTFCVLQLSSFFQVNRFRTHVFFQPASAIRLLSSKDGQSLTWCSHHRFTTSFLVYHVFFHFWMPTRFGGIPWNAMGYATLFYQVGGIDDAKISILENQQQPTNSTNQPIQATNGHTSRLQISNEKSSSFGGGSFFGGCMTQG